MLRKVDLAIMSSLDFVFGVTSRHFDVTCDRGADVAVHIGAREADGRRLVPTNSDSARNDFPQMPRRFLDVTWQSPASSFPREKRHMN